MPAAPATLDPAVAAKAAQLRYVSDRAPGIARSKRGEGFAYRDAHGRAVRDAATLARIRSLAIPPAWTDVWICPDPDGHLQAVGKDARGRKQYRYHPRWREVRDESKFEHLLAFGTVLPRIRLRVNADLRRPGLPREKVLAAVVRLMEYTHGRVGNDEYARANGTFGLTTLRDRHVKVRGANIDVRFKGKHGLVHARSLEDPQLAPIVRACSDLPGEELFQYLDESGKRRRVTSNDVNEYLRELSGQPITAKYFRTWAGTRRAVLECLCLADGRPTKKQLAQVAERVAERLGNTPAVCRKSYIHPCVFDAHLDGSLAGLCGTLAAAQPIDGAVPEPTRAALERAVLKLLRAQVRAKQGAARAATRRAA